MCGIVGIVACNAPLDPGVLERATHSLAHRGPDDHGTVILRDRIDREVEIGLGNRRLAILDLSPLGHQPMHDPATGNWIVYNGELYNFREVRAKLERAGCQFVSHSDTEVILKAYGAWGENCLDEFRGMFAFAIWDARLKCLFIARDPMGIKPLYYFHNEKCFLFASEIRTLLGTGLVGRKIDPAGLVTFLTFGSLYDPGTLIEGVRVLPAGHWLKWSAGKLDVRPYWDLIESFPPEIDRNDRTFAARTQAERQVAEMLDESVRMQLVSDVPVGVFLSGGIDSSSLVAILHRNGIRANTFSVVFHEANLSEAEYSRAIAKQFHTEHHEINVSQSDLLAAIDPAIAAMDLPTIDGVNTYFVSERTRAAGVKVALSGLGGDEIFAGYASFRAVPRMERFANAISILPARLNTLIGDTFAALSPTNDQNHKVAELLRDGGARPYFLSRMLFTSDRRHELLGAKNSSHIGFSPDNHSFSEAANRARQLDPINRVSYLEARCYMLNTLLRDSDFMSMAHGLEVRVPLIDHQLARRVLALPGSWKLDGGVPKPLLVKALGVQLPDKIVHRPKRGFTLPFDYWLRDALRPVLEKSLGKLEDGPLSGFIDRRAASHVWQDFLDRKTSWSRPWSLYVLQNWCQRNLAN